MYNPLRFAVAQVDALHDFIETHRFGILISHDAAEPVASHLPFLLDRSAGHCGSLSGHFAKANTHWQCAAERPVLSVFHGPHAYISPSWITAQDVVPTWNYVAVHAYGILRLVNDRDRLLDILRRSIACFESDSAQPWSIEQPNSAYIDQMLEGIVGFQIEVERLEGKWKLSQNHTAERQAEIVQGLTRTGRAEALEIAKLMGQ